MTTPLLDATRAALAQMSQLLGQADPDLAEDGWLAHALRAHDRVVHEVFARVPVLPLRFGTLCTGRADVAGMLRADGARLRAAMEPLRDSAEWTVRAVAAGQSDVDDGHDGTAWMMRRHAAALWHEALAAHAVRASERNYLVRRRDEAGFAAAAARVGVEIVGPRPPYHFAKGLGDG